MKTSPSSSSSASDIGSAPPSNIFDSAHTTTSNTCISPASSVDDNNNHHLKHHHHHQHEQQQQQHNVTISPQSKSLFVEALVDSAAIIIEAIWPCATASTCFIRTSVPLKHFIQETLRRSRTSYSTLQLALYYLIKLQPAVRAHRLASSATSATEKPGKVNVLDCGRRSFLASLIVACKYVQDRSFALPAWSKISGLSAAELRSNELGFMDSIGWNAHVKYATYERLGRVLVECACDWSPLCVKQRVWGERFEAMDTDISVTSWPAVPSAGSPDADSASAAAALTHANVSKLNTLSNSNSNKSLKRKAADADSSSDSTLVNVKKSKSDVENSPMRISYLLNQPQSYSSDSTRSLKPSASLVSGNNKSNSSWHTRIQAWTVDVSAQTAGAV